MHQQLSPWPQGTREWLIKRKQHDPHFSFESWIADMDHWPVIDRGIHFLCMDNLLDDSEVLRQVREMFHLPEQTISASRRYGYMLQSPGGNHTALYPKVIKTLVRKGLKEKRRFRKTHAFFYEHSDCTAKETETWATPLEGVRWYISLYKAHEKLFPGILVGRPQIYILHVETQDSLVSSEYQEIPESTWDEIEPFVLNQDRLWQVIRGQNLDMYLPEGATIVIDQPGSARDQNMMLLR